MERNDFWFKQLDRATSRENFLEKEMLEADVRLLESRTNFFEKLAVLAAGVLTVAITFLGLSVNNKPLHQAILDHQCGLEAALAGIVLGLLGCIIHNYIVSLATAKLSKQIEETYHSASVFRGWKECTDNPWIMMDQHTAASVAKYESLADSARVKKDKLVAFASRVGTTTGLAVCFGYGLILYEIIKIIGATIA